VDFEPAANGRVVVPTQMRRTIGWNCPMVMYVEDGRVIIEPRAQLAARTKREVAEAWKGEGSAVDELIRERRTEAAREAGA
jgi:bifunctional DNA-binding transcriptional regulator/antitoxin component of YhaV-PrlF toxin-antitoxin module